MRTAPPRVSASTGDLLAEAIALAKRLKLRYLRRVSTDLVPGACGDVQFCVACHREHRRKAITS